MCAGLGVAGCGGSSDSSSEATKPDAEAGGSGSEQAAATESPEGTKPTVVVPKGAPPKKLEVNDLEEGSGAEVKAGDEVTVQYVGVKYKSGEEFYATWDKGEAPFSFKVGAGKVIAGWEQGIKGMKVGGRRELIIPSALAYGEAGATGIPPNETLVLVMDLLEVKQ
jgi:peptidylprolyl isomerase